MGAGTGDRLFDTVEVSGSSPLGPTMTAMSLAKDVLKSVLPRPVRQFLRDRFEDFMRHRPAPHRGRPHYNLSPAQIYPEGTRFDDCLRDGIAPLLEGLVITKQTPVASIGSCFAQEFARHMREEGFHYLTAEDDTTGFFPTSANWGRVYAIPCFRQIVLYSTTDDFPMPVGCSEEGWFDPLREEETSHFATREEAEAAIRAHRAASRRIFAEARVLILTLGQSEGWVERRTGLVWGRRPLRDHDQFEARIFSLEENVAWLEESLTRLRALNPQLDVLLTVSPVPRFATFAGAEVITTSFLAKCTLRLVAERMTRALPRVWYFPSLEVVLAYNPHTLKSDNRHAQFASVDRVLALFDATVVR